jgi:hypothetical protein
VVVLGDTDSPPTGYRNGEFHGRSGGFWFKGNGGEVGSDRCRVVVACDTAGEGFVDGWVDAIEHLGRHDTWIVRSRQTGP